MAVEPDKPIAENPFSVGFKTGLKNTIPDIFFMFLPLIVIAFVLAIKSNLWNIFSQAEWSFASAVLSGQVIVKLVYAVSASKALKNSDNIAIIIAGIIVLLLVPSLIVLVFMLITNPLPLSLLIVQIAIFILSLFVFILFGATSGGILRSNK